MIPGIDPRKMKAVMKQMGISQEEIDAERVIIEKIGGGKIIIENPSVTKVKMQGQENFQITGEVKEELSKFEINKEDIQTIVEKTGCDEKQAKESLEKTKDLAESILELSN